MSDFAELVLLLGDSCIPSRACEIPKKFNEILFPGRVKHVLCTGNVTSPSVLEYLRTLAPNIHIVKGPHDLNQRFSSLPQHTTINVGDYSIGLINGYQVQPWNSNHALADIQSQLQVDILVTGNQVPSDIILCDSYAILQPGSITGSYDVRLDIQPQDHISYPSFMILSIKGKKIIVYTYILVDDDIRVQGTDLYADLFSRRTTD